MLNPNFLTVVVGAEVLKGMCVEPPYTPWPRRTRGGRVGAPCPRRSSPGATLLDNKPCERSARDLSAKNIAPKLNESARCKILVTRVGRVFPVHDQACRARDLDSIVRRGIVTRHGAL